MGSAMRELLMEPRYDLLPYDGFAAALTAVPRGSAVAITLAPELGVESTVACTELAAKREYRPVPHIAPRFIADLDELNEIVHRLEVAGVRDIFVPGGDRAEPLGELTCAYDLLVALEDRGHAFDEIGIAGYPEGHSAIDDGTIAAAIDRKAPYATYMATQLCFDPRAIVGWIAGTRSRGIDLDVEVGIPGVVTYGRLMRVSWEYGVARPIAFLRKTTGVLGFASEIVRSGGRYEPTELVEELAVASSEGEVRIDRLRMYTFNFTGPTERWRARQLRA